MHFNAKLQVTNIQKQCSMTQTLQSKNTISEETATEKQCMKTEKD